MQGILLIEHQTGQQSIYIPEAHIRLYVNKFNNPDEWRLCCFRTDRLWVLEWEHVPGGLKPTKVIPIVDHLKNTHAWTSTVEVPEHIVQFAIESEYLQRVSIEALTHILEGSLITQNIHQGFTKFLQKLAAEEPEKLEHAYLEEEIAKEVLLLIRGVPGGGYH